jgi:hypothetical protein
MRSILRVINLLLVILVAIGAIGQLSSGVPQAIGGALWSIPFLLTLRALSDGTVRVRAAIIANIAGALLLFGIALFAGKLIAKDASTSFGMFVVFMLLCSPFIGNVIGLRKLKTRIQPARLREQDEIPLLDVDSAIPRLNEEVAAVGADAEVPVAPALDTAATTISSSVRRGNYFVRHWRGDLSLPISYWINNSLSGAVLVVLTLVVSSQLNTQASLRMFAISALTLLSLITIYAVWAPVGVWRSAEKHAARGGSPGWATTAKVVIVLSALGSLNAIFTTIFPQIKEYAQLALGHDAYGKIEAEVSTNGRYIMLKGGFGMGSSEEVRRLLDHVPGAKALVLESSGGRLLEASRIADIARERHLNTYVETHCESACTYVFLAGRDRAATPNAKLGFHQPHFPGIDASKLKEATQKMLEVYRQAGVSEAFLRRVQATASKDMWYPERDELIDAGVINRVSLGGEVDTYRSRSELELAFRSDKLLSAIEARFPGSLDEAVDAAWAAHAAGQPDGSMMTAARQTLIRHYSQLFQTTDDALVADYLELGLAQMRAAQAVSDEACALLAEGRLNISQVLPKDLSVREQDWLLKALSGNTRQFAQWTEDKATAVLLPLFEDLSPQSLAVMAEPDKYRDQQRAFCRANIEVLEKIHAQPVTARARMFRALQYLAYTKA